MGLDYIFMNILTKSLALIWEIYITLHNKCIMLPLLKTAYLLAVNLVLLDFWSINAYYEGQIPFIAISCNQQQYPSS